MTNLLNPQVGLEVGHLFGAFVGLEVGTFVGIGTAILQKAPVTPGLITRENAAGTTPQGHIVAHTLTLTNHPNMRLP